VLLQWAPSIDQPVCPRGLQIARQWRYLEP
jgi:hypothetical protein